MGGFLHIIIDTHNTNDAILVSVPSRGMGGFLPTKPVPCLKNICCFRPLSRYGWFPTLFGWGIYAIVKGCVSVPSRGMGGFLHKADGIDDLITDCVSVPSRGMGGFLLK